jgi:hypothetical protein
MMLVMALLHMLHPAPFGLEGEMLDAMHKLVIAGGENADGKSQRRAADAMPVARDQRAEGGGGDEDRGHRGVQRAKQHFEMVGILMVVIVDPLPRRGQPFELIGPLAMQDILVEHVPHQRIDQCRRRHDGQRAQGRGGVKAEDHKARHRQHQIGDDRIMLEIGGDQLRQIHPVKIMRALPEGELALVQR